VRNRIEFDLRPAIAFKLTVPEQIIEEPIVSAWPPSPDVAEAIRAEAFRGLKSLPRRGAEIGGFLIAHSNSETEHCVDGIELIPTEHLYGPLYRLSPADLDLFRSKVDQVRSTLPGRTLGYFRTCTREEFLLDALDLQVVHDVLPDARFIYLVKPFLNGDCRVRVFSPDPFIQENSAGTPYLSEFSLRLNLNAFRPEAAPNSFELLPVSEHPVSKPGSEDTVETSPQVASHSMQSRLLDNLRAFNWNWLLFTALAALVFFTSAWGYGRWQAAASRKDLTLRVDTAAGNIHLTWDHQSSALRSAQKATLWIEDQGVRRELKLNQTALSTGSLVYVSDTPDVTFRMQVEQNGGQPFIGSLRVVRDIPARPVDPAKSAGSAQPEVSEPAAQEALKPKPASRATRRPKTASKVHASR
jgi:hypothetical protein